MLACVPYEEGKIMLYHLYKKSNKRIENIVLRNILAVLMTAVVMSEYCSAAESNQKTFSLPSEAFKTMVAAFKTGNQHELTAIFGPEEKDLISIDKGIGKKRCERFLKAYEERNRVETVDENKALLYVGKKDWPWPVPVVKVGERWRFDTKEGEEEISARRIGKNEIAAIQVCLAYVDAQQEYVANHVVNGLAVYAQKFVDETGKGNGLCGNTKEGVDRSPLGPLIAGACATDDSGAGPASESEPYHGYYYRILRKQGPDAPGGSYDYVLQGMMVGGFALVAYPAYYNSSGVMTFIVNQDDIVYQKDLGKDTEKTAEGMTAFNPDRSWQMVD